MKVQTMFHRPTVRSQRNPKPKRYWFTDEPLSFPREAGRKPEDNTLRFSPLSNEHQVQQDGAEPTRIVSQRDSATEQRQTDLAPSRPPFPNPALGNSGRAPQGPPSPVPGAAGSPSSTTTGGLAPTGMMYDLVAAFELVGNTFAYWPKTTPDAYRIFKSKIDVLDEEPKEVGAYPLVRDSYYATDQDTRFFRVWRVSMNTNDLGTTTSPGVKNGLAGAKAVNDRAMTIRAMNAANAAKWSK
jgi:hypothetical protein